jgi:hypothetical protein
MQDDLAHRESLSSKFRTLSYDFERLQGFLSHEMVSREAAERAKEAARAKLEYASPHAAFSLRTLTLLQIDDEATSRRIGTSQGDARGSAKVPNCRSISQNTLHGASRLQ